MLFRSDLAARLENLNRERRERSQRATDQALEQVGDATDLPLIFAGSPDFPSGLIGLVAGRLAERWHRPAVALEVGPEVSRGSCRSIPGFNIVEAVRACGDLLLRHGGHPQAAGFTVATARIPELRERLLEVAARQLAGQRPVPFIEVDDVVDLDRLHEDVLRGLDWLAPHGYGKPEPVFCALDVELQNVRTMGADGAHARARVRQGSQTWEAVGFGLGERLSRLGGRAHVLFTPEPANWRGESFVQLNLRDVRPADVWPFA